MIGFIESLQSAFKWMIRGYHIKPWDYAYLLEVLKHQIADMEKYTTTYGNTICSSKKAEQMRYTLDILKKIENEDDGYPDIIKAKSNMKLLFNYINAHILFWWD